MYINADRDLGQVLAKKGTDSYGKVRNDPRIIRLGRFLRRYWIDELPNLINLFLGDIKPVGIRPRAEQDWEEVEKYKPEHKRRCLRQKPGLISGGLAREGNLFEVEAEYLDAYEKNPAKTDREYFVKVIRRIMHGLRGS